MPEQKQTIATTETHIPITEYNEKLMCDFGHRFHANSVKLIPFKNSGEASLGELRFVDEDKKTRASLNSAPPAGFLVACPVCGVIHIAGFSLVKEGDVLETDENVVPERNIQISL